jgi:hypothetical protein
MLGDIRSERLLYVKAGLFLTLGTASVALILYEWPNWRLAALLAIAIWAFCRAYYFAFYVIQHYADPGYRFAGLWSFAAYAWRRWRQPPG